MARVVGRSTTLPRYGDDAAPFVICVLSGHFIEDSDDGLLSMIRVMSRPRQEDAADGAPSCVIRDVRAAPCQEDADYGGR